MCKHGCIAFRIVLAQHSDAHLKLIGPEFGRLAGGAFPEQ
jgi:hypothetical protein